MQGKNMLNFCIILILFSTVYGDGEDPSHTEKPADGEKPANAEAPSGDDNKPSEEPPQSTEHSTGETEGGEGAMTSTESTAASSDSEKPPSTEAGDKEDKPSDDEKTSTENAHIEEPVKEEERPILSSSWDKLPKECGKSRFKDQTTETEIIADVPAKLGQFPWIARLGRKVYGFGLVFSCAGSLISKFYVVSAAHCDDHYDTIRLGENDVTKDPDCTDMGDCAPPYQDIPISKFIFQDYCRNNFENDLLLIELETPAEFNPYVQPVCLPRTPIRHHEFINKHITMSGFGTVRSKGQRTEYLRYAVNVVVEPDECKKMFQEPVDDSQWCIGTPGPHKLDNNWCSGDSGGPVTKEMEVEGDKRIHLIGAVSYGAEECEHGPNIHTDATFFGEWIVNKMEKY